MRRLTKALLLTAVLLMMTGLALAAAAAPSGAQPTTPFEPLWLQPPAWIPIAATATRPDTAADGRVWQQPPAKIPIAS